MFLWFIIERLGWCILEIKFGVLAFFLSRLTRIVFGCQFWLVLVKRFLLVIKMLCFFLLKKKIVTLFLNLLVRHILATRKAEGPNIGDSIPYENLECFFTSNHYLYFMFSSHNGREQLRISKLFTNSCWSRCFIWICASKPIFKIVWASKQVKKIEVNRNSFNWAWYIHSVEYKRDQRCTRSNDNWVETKRTH